MGIRRVTSENLLDFFKNLSVIPTNFQYISYRLKSFQSSKIDRLTKRALKQHLYWSEKLDYPDSDWHSYANEQILSYRDRTQLPFEKVSSQNDCSGPELLKSSYNNVEMEYNGMMKELIIDGFGKITVSHSNIFDSNVDVMLVPMPKCLLPHTGFGIITSDLGLKVLELGGKELVKAIVKQAKELLKTSSSEHLDYGKTNSQFRRCNYDTNIQ